MLGSAIGLACLFLLPNAYSVIVALAVVMFVMNVIAGFRPDWRYGVVAAVALALADTTGDINVAQARAVAIGLGIVIGIAVSLIIWPESAAKRSMRYKDQALRAASDRYKWALQDEKNESEADSARRHFHDAMSSGRSLFEATKGDHRSRLNTSLNAIETLYNSIVLINRVDSPLSRFDDQTISRDELIDAGQRVILSLQNNESSSDDALKNFRSAIKKVRDSLSDQNLSDDGTTGAASVVFGLNEMADAMTSVLEQKQNGSDQGFQAPIAIKEAMPAKIVK